MTTTVRCGADLVEIGRIRAAVSRFGQPFLDRIWTAGEQADCLRPDRQSSAGTPVGLADQLTSAAAASLAARFAAKEAAAKALGTGIGRAGVGWTDLAVVRLASGEPELHLSGSARLVFNRLGGLSINISLSHERQYALAFCTLTCAAVEVVNDQA